MKSVVIIGGGNLAEATALAIAECKTLTLRQMYVRNEERGAELRALTGAEVCNKAHDLASADLYIMAVSDNAIASLSEELPFAEGAIVAHTSGSTPLTAISSSLRRAVFYPMQTFTKGRRVDFQRIPIFVEAEDQATLSEVEQTARQLSQSVRELSSEERRKLHLAAVFVCNFSNAMYTAGEELVRESDLGFDIFAPLIEESVAKACIATSVRDVQTGPARRGDTTTMNRHLEMLEGQDSLINIYKIISNYIWETSKRI